MCGGCRLPRKAQDCGLDLLQESPYFVSGERQRVANGFGLHGLIEFPINYQNEDIAAGWMVNLHDGAARAFRNSRKLNQAFERLAYKSRCLVSSESRTVHDVTRCPLLLSDICSRDQATGAANRDS